MGPERQEKAGGMFMGLCARVKRRVGLQKGGQHGKCWNTQDSVILFPKWCSAVLLQGLTNPHLWVSITRESWDSITVSTPDLPSEK